MRLLSIVSHPLWVEGQSYWPFSVRTPNAIGPTTQAHRRWQIRFLSRLRGQPKEYHLVVGLGNPGPEYARHRHNVGFQCLDRLAEAHGLSFDRLQHKCRVALGNIAGADVILAKPLNYMNLSGQPVRSLVHHYRVPFSRLLVIHDDLDLPLGTIRLRPQGGSGGHRGMTSVIEALGSRDFPRLRVGIGRPPPGVDPTDHVLSDFTPDELPVIEEVYERVVAAVACFLAEGIEVAMSRYNALRPILSKENSIG